VLTLFFFFVAVASTLERPVYFSKIGYVGRLPQLSQLAKSNQTQLAICPSQDNQHSNWKTAKSQNTAKHILQEDVVCKGLFATIHRGKKQKRKCGGWDLNPRTPSG
jgi:hypothetical protein